ncbi:putative acetyltransferase [Salmonella phage 18-India]|nr:putative acetyltransferase [Salmonella phage 18-India]
MTKPSALFCFMSDHSLRRTAEATQHRHCSKRYICILLVGA